MKTKYQLKNYKSMLFIVVILSLLSCKKSDFGPKPLDYAVGTVRIAKWQGDKKSALNMLFDDSTPGQAALGVPALNSRGLIGTWFVNPGREEYAMGKEVWENDAPNGGQELANHTMSHTGAGSYDVAVYEIGEAAKIIWQIRGDEPFGSLMAFNQGGGTSWDGVDIAPILEEYKNIDRVKTNIGVPVKAKTILPGSKVSDMYEPISMFINDSNIIRLHFHGIAAVNGNPPDDYGNGAVYIEEFKAFADKLVALKSELWISGFIQTYKYIQERTTASIKLLQYDDDTYGVQLTCDKDPKYFDEPLTILVYLPKEWTACQVTNEGVTADYQMTNGILQFDAKPNKGDISIIKK